MWPVLILLILILITIDAYTDTLRRVFKYVGPVGLAILVLYLLFNMYRESKPRSIPAAAAWQTHHPIPGFEHVRDLTGHRGH